MPTSRHVNAWAYGITPCESRAEPYIHIYNNIVKMVFVVCRYQENGMLTNKSDVYGFGIVMMEILTGQNQLYIAHRVR